MYGEPVVRNALHFLEFSFESLKDAPKLAAVGFGHFFAGIDLKAFLRLSFVLLALGFLLRLLFRSRHLSFDGGFPVACLFFLRGDFHLFLFLRCFFLRRCLFLIDDLEQLCLQGFHVFGVFMNGCIPKCIVEFLFEIIHRPHCRLIEKELCVVHIRKDLANASLVLELRLAHFNKVHVGTDVRSQVSDRGVGFVLFIKKSHGWLLSLHFYFFLLYRERREGSRFLKRVTCDW